ncbi:MAG: pyridoxamine 5'-phosphate oxidase family protein [Kiritimatiellae bacterium]|nr:pyridoxamine 5'-phosphate oxidase family protein [Kiritimatiellia bacterium]
MRRKDREVTDPSEIDAMLDRIYSAHIAMVAPDGGSPYCVAMNYAWEKNAAGEYVFWFHCANEGRKSEILKANSNVWIFAEREGSFLEKTTAAGTPYMTMTYESVSGAGVVEFLAEYDLAAKRRALALLCKRFTATPISSVPDAVIAITSVFRATVPVLSAKKH